MGKKKQIKQTTKCQNDDDGKKSRKEDKGKLLSVCSVKQMPVVVSKSLRSFTGEP